MARLRALKNWAKRVKRDAVALWFACRHPDTPVIIKGWCLLTVTYALSPIDLIPDFIPLLGYIDEVILLPAMIWLAVYFLPESVILSCRSQAEQWLEKRQSKPKSYVGAGIIIAIWIGLAYLGWRWFNSA